MEEHSPLSLSANPSGLTENDRTAVLKRVHTTLLVSSPEPETAKKTITHARTGYGCRASDKVLNVISTMNYCVPQISGVRG